MQHTIALNTFQGKEGEKLFQFIFQFGYYNQLNLTTTSGEPVKIISVGKRNNNQGPDFNNASVKIGNTQLFGSIELHLNTSDWEKHFHQTDANYNNVILHVVYHHDKELNHHIPVLELNARISDILLNRYSHFMLNKSFIPCDGLVANVENLTWISWKERLLVERLADRSQRILSLLEEAQGSWEACFWWLLAKNFGLKVNTEAFEQMARSISPAILAKHKSSMHQVEALLFGQANLLSEDFEDPYPQLLQREYTFLQKKWALKPITMPLQFLRMRPGNFPTVRLAQLAVLIYQSSHLFSKILEVTNVSDLRKMFDVTANDFWHYHYTFKKSSAFKEKKLGGQMIDNIIINTIIPVLFAYGSFHKNNTFKEKAMTWLEKMEPEKNKVVSDFQRLGVACKSAFDSQALLQLYKNYCQSKKCLQCAVGNQLLKPRTQVSSLKGNS